MKNRLIEIVSSINNMDDIQIINPFLEEGLMITGLIRIDINYNNESLEFRVEIYPQYPLKSHDCETIKFINDKLVTHNHVMSDGSICIHTAHSPILKNKLQYDFNSLRLWIDTYYINKYKDIHYEHIIVPQILFRDSYHAYFFNEVNYVFRKNQFGFLDYSQMSLGVYQKKNITNSIIQEFKDKNGKRLIDIGWNLKLKSLPRSIGLFLFVELPPTKHKRFAYQTWGEIKHLICQDFLDFLHAIEKKLQKDKGCPIPLFIGYKISDAEIHWQSIILEIGQFPIHGVKENKKYFTGLQEDSVIHWAMTRNCSYKYFYGRGKLNDKLTNSKILLIGIGAIGSIIATTIVRSGCTKIDLIDFDVKEPENICRSEYSFVTGITNKVNELSNHLYSLSPFIEINLQKYDFSEMFNFYLKSFCKDKGHKKSIEDYLNQYDVIFDCSTDNDLLYVFSQLDINSTLINLSISNHSKQLVCASEKNRYEFIQNQFNHVLDFDIEDLYNPTGCWSPTFKASYNDINTLVQYAVKHINLKYEDGLLKNFVIETNNNDGFTLKLKEF